MKSLRKRAEEVGRAFHKTTSQQVAPPWRPLALGYPQDYSPSHFRLETLLQSCSQGANTDQKLIGVGMDVEVCVGVG